MLAGFVLGLLIASVPPQSAWAHASLVKSSPANGTSLTQPPSMIRATFSEELDKASVMRLYNESGKMLASGGLDAAVSNHRVLRIVPPRLAPGSYVAQWVAISADDGNVHKGSFRFSVVGARALASGAAAGPPLLHLVTPANGARLENPVAVVIETRGDISQLTVSTGMSSMSGMGHAAAPAVHLHVAVDGTVFMPAADQMKPLGQSRYEYRVPRTLAAGTHTITVFWADNKTHQAAGPVQTATFTIR